MDFTELVDLASEKLGGAVLVAAAGNELAEAVADALVDRDEQQQDGAEDRRRRHSLSKSKLHRRCSFPARKHPRGPGSLLALPY